MSHHEEGGGTLPLHGGSVPPLPPNIFPTIGVKSHHEEDGGTLPLYGGNVPPNLGMGEFVS